MFNKKGQTAGLVTGLIFGIASLIIGVIIAFIIVSTLSNAGLLESTRTVAGVTNETTLNTVSINATGYQLAGLSSQFAPGTIIITSAWNITNSTGPLPIVIAGNVTVSSVGIVTNASSLEWGNVSLSYTSAIFSDEERSTTSLTGNFSAGVDNVSEQIPTILLIAAIVLILGVLAILVIVWQQMRIGGGSI